MANNTSESMIKILKTELLLRFLTNQMVKPRTLDGLGIRLQHLHVHSHCRTNRGTNRTVPPHLNTDHLPFDLPLAHPNNYGLFRSLQIVYFKADQICNNYQDTVSSRGSKTILTRWLSAAAIRRSIASECPS